MPVCSLILRASRISRSASARSPSKSSALPRKSSRVWENRRAPRRSISSRNRADFLLGSGRLPQDGQHHAGGCPRVDLGAQMTDLGRGVSRCDTEIQRLPQWSEIECGLGHLAAVGDLDPAEAVSSVASSTHRARWCVRADHPPADVLGVAEAAQRRGLELGRAGSPGKLQAAAGARAGSPRCRRAGRRDCRAGSGSRARSASRPERRGRGLGTLQIGEGAVEVVGHPLDRREPDPGPAALGVVARRRRAPPRRRTAPPASDRDRAGRLPWRQASAKRSAGSHGERETALDQPQRALVAVCAARCASAAREIGRGRPRVVGPVEVLGVQHRVAPGEPLGRAPVQLAPPAPREVCRRPRRGSARGRTGTPRPAAGPGSAQRGRSRA